MNLDEVCQLRAFCASRAALDVKAGRVGGVMAWMLVDLALSTGLRSCEMAGLTVEAVDLDREYITVSRAKKRGPPRPESLAGARPRNRDRVSESLAIGADLVWHLRQYIQWTGRVRDPLRSPHTIGDYGRDKVLLRRSPNDGDCGRAKGPLFLGARGPLTAQGLQRIWRAAVRRAGLPGTPSIHSARHTIAVHLLRKTGNLRQVQKQLGHSSPVTTANMYADVTFSDMQTGLNGLYVR
jgi:integrase